jgi:HSP20 family molecular chaperone IbpA
MTEDRQDSQETSRTYSPAVDVYDTGDSVVLVADLPGVSQDGLTVNVEQNVLTISGRCGEKREPEGEPWLREFEPADFYRSFTLTDEADQANINAEFSAGVLTLTVPRRQVRPGKRIDIAVE